MRDQAALPKSESAAVESIEPSQTQMFEKPRLADLLLLQARSDEKPRRKSR